MWTRHLARYDRREIFAAPVAPFGGGSLRVEIDNGDLFAGKGKSDSQAQGGCGLAPAPLFSKDGQLFHMGFLIGIDDDISVAL